MILDFLHFFLLLYILHILSIKDKEAVLWKANFTLRGAGLKLKSTMEAKFRDGLLGINMVLLVSKNGWKLSMGKLAKGDQKKLAEVILCLSVLGKKRCYHGRRMFRDWSDKLRSWTSATSER